MIGRMFIESVVSGQLTPEDLVEIEVGQAAQATASALGGSFEKGFEFGQHPITGVKKGFELLKGKLAGAALIKAFPEELLRKMIPVTLYSDIARFNRTSGKIDIELKPKPLFSKIFEGKAASALLTIDPTNSILTVMDKDRKVIGKSQIETPQTGEEVTSEEGIKTYLKSLADGLNDPNSKDKLAKAINQYTVAYLYSDAKDRVMKNGKVTVTAFPKPTFVKLCPFKPAFLVYEFDDANAKLSMLNKEGQVYQSWSTKVGKLNVITGEGLDNLLAKFAAGIKKYGEKVGAEQAAKAQLKADQEKAAQTATKTSYRK